MLQAGEHVQTRRLGLNPESVNALSADVKSPSYLSRIKNWVHTQIGGIHMAWKTLPAKLPETSVILGHTPCYIASVIKKFDPEFKNFLQLKQEGKIPENSLYHDLTIFSKEYEQFTSKDKSITELIGNFNKLREKELKLPWLYRFRSFFLARNARRLIAKGLSNDQLIDHHVTPYTYFSSIPTKDKKALTGAELEKWSNEPKVQDWIEFTKRYDERYPFPKELIIE
ncbi:uncharacterized protein PHALS_03108 [Plasmopara halstedii]|uniref:Uncharacterized protein n=1 Tax=Plasmopara halstedii TaxID=4781 RepID=A0A0P1A7H0_PLAHL|nr:uncharacterized protein PHALS_03108 [Plasmopara halstedii]CEG36560.1 hypothetical protein PHALS_03108 [Plasmopara halstedii]|eukprot:XP_024572929.1 hypothetical protein PHALS_03108 [Plasmopara halstedii]